MKNQAREIPKLFRCISCFLILALLLSGCSISPTPLTEGEISQRVEKDMVAMAFDQEAIGDEPITLYDSMARALKYNLDHRLKIMEEALSVQQLDVSRYDMLPEITASAGYNYRNNDEGSFSQSLIDGTQSLVASTSRDRSSRTANISIMWNVLDFGVSYARAKQQADRVLIIEERRRKVIQNILQDVRYAYWRAVSSERLIQDMLGLLNQTKIALKNSREIAEQRLQSPKASLEYQKALLENIRLLWNIIQNLTPAKIELASLMNIQPGVAFKLTEETWTFPEIPQFTAPLPELEKMALLSRPELREEDYRSRISATDVKKSLLQMMPSLNLALSPKYDSTDFLYNQTWWDAGAIVSQNIVKLFSGPSAMKAAKAQVEVDSIRRQAVSMAVLVQTNLAYQRYGLAKKEYAVSRQLEHISNQLNKQIEAEKSAGSANELDAIKSMTNVLIAKMRHYNAYAELQNSVGRIYNTLGIDILPTQIESSDVATLASAIKHSIDTWQETVNPLQDGQPQTGSGIAGLPESSYDHSDLSMTDPLEPSPNFSAVAASLDNRPSDATDKLLKDSANFSRPSASKVAFDAIKKTTFIVRDNKAKAEKENTEELDMEPFEITLRSASEASDVLRRHLLSSEEDGPVQIQIKSTGLKQTPSWYRRDVTKTPAETGVLVRLSSPLAIHPSTK